MPLLSIIIADETIIISDCMYISAVCEMASFPDGQKNEDKIQFAVTMLLFIFIQHIWWRKNEQTAQLLELSMLLSTI